MFVFGKQAVFIATVARTQNSTQYICASHDVHVW